MRFKKKVVFFFPAFSSLEATAPLGILAVSTPLLRAGYEVRIIDSTITSHFQKRVLEELEDALCLAVSLVTGPMIRETVQIARETKRLFPGLPVILGGWHPSLLPDQTLAAEYVDVVVRGQGEEALLRVVDQLFNLRLDFEDIDRAVQRFEQQISAIIATNPDAEAYLTELERRADAVQEGQTEEGVEPSALPPSEALIKDLEEFLKRRREQQGQ